MCKTVFFFFSDFQYPRMSIPIVQNEPGFNMNFNPFVIVQVSAPRSPTHMTKQLELEAVSVDQCLCRGLVQVTCQEWHSSPVSGIIFSVLYHDNSATSSFHFIGSKQLEITWLEHLLGKCSGDRRRRGLQRGVMGRQSAGLPVLNHFHLSLQRGDPGLPRCQGEGKYSAGGPLRPPAHNSTCVSSGTLW